MFMPNKEPPWLTGTPTRTFVHDDFTPVLLTAAPNRVTWKAAAVLGTFSFKGSFIFESEAKSSRWCKDK